MNTSVQPNIDKLEIFHEDEHIIAINKPNNYLVHQSSYAGNLEEQSIIEFLRDQENTMFYPIHRLDRKTSGILLMAKKKEYVSEFQQLFIQKKVEKTYYAVVRGFSPATLNIDFSVKNEDSDTYKEAFTSLTTIAQHELNLPVTPYDSSRYSLVQLTPKTGRMHQLRKHMNKISHPIVGDYKYGDRFHNRNFEDNFKWNYLFLHAHRLQFTHPFTNINTDLKASFPDDWQQLFQQFDWKI